MTDFSQMADSVKGFFARKDQPSALERGLIKRQLFQTDSKPGQMLVLEEDELKALVEHDQKHMAHAEAQTPLAPAVPAAKPNVVDATLAERGGRYGLFKDNSKVYMALMDIVHTSPNAQAGKLSPEAYHALGNISTKLARLLTGDPTYYDNWRDIAGYATLMDAICRGEER